MMDENKYYKINDLNLATFLCVKGFQLLNIENGETRKTFVFERSNQLTEMVRIFYYAEPSNQESMVNAHEILQTIRTLKAKLYSNITRK